MLSKLLEELSKEINKTYKISQDEVKIILLKKLETKVELKQKWENSPSLKEIYRTSEFKNFFKGVKKEIYFALRTYQKSNESGEIEDTHVSTQERALHKDEFFSQIDEYFLKAKNIIDVGGGIFPLTVTLDWYKNVESFVWLDKDKISAEKIDKFKKAHSLGQITLFCENIGKNKWEHYLPEGKEFFDLAILLKTVPVINRQERSLLSFLAQIPAKNIIITGSKTSMVKKANVQKREDAVLKAFVDMTGKKIVKEIDIFNEFGYVLE